MADYKVQIQIENEWTDVDSIAEEQFNIKDHVFSASKADKFNNYVGFPTRLLMLVIDKEENPKYIEVKEFQKWVIKNRKIKCLNPSRYYKEYIIKI